MKKHIIFILLAISTFCISQKVEAQCNNGNFEYGNTSGWYGWWGYNDRGAVMSPKLNSGFQQNRHTIMTSGNDPYLSQFGISMPMVVEGQYSLRLGNSNNDFTSDATTVAYTFQVTNSNANFSFRYAMVLEDGNDPNHNDKTNPFFGYLISTAPVGFNGATVFGTLAMKKFVAKATDPYYQRINGGNVVYKPWQVECVDLSKYIGKTVTIYFFVADCTLSGHFAYAYIDALCQRNDPVPDFTYPQSVCWDRGMWVDGSSSQNVNYHYWQVDKLSSNNINNVVPNTTIRLNGSAAPPGYIGDLLSLLRPWGRLLSGYYKVSLVARNCFSNWVSKSVVIEIKTPNLNVVEDEYRCCGGANGFAVSAWVDNATATIATTDFEWFTFAGESLGSGVVSISEGIFDGVFAVRSRSDLPSWVTETGRYKVTYTDANGCTAEKWVNLINKPGRMRAKITTDYCPTNCNSGLNRLTATLDDYWHESADGLTNCFVFDLELLLKAGHHNNLTYQWSTGETTRDINVHPGVNQYQVTVSNGCVSSTATLDITTLRKVSGEPNLLIPTAFKPGAAVDNVFRITDANLPLGAKLAYNARRYRFQVYGRGGRCLLDKKGGYNVVPVPCDGYENGEIQWDGTYKGVKQSIDTYTFLLEIWNCNGAFEKKYLYKGHFDLIR